MICLTLIAFVILTDEGPATVAVMATQEECEIRLREAESDAGCQEMEVCFDEKQ